MKIAPLAPQKHLFVCVNARPAGDPLGAGCSERGESVYAALKTKVAQSGLVTRVWITRTHCLGLCPRKGATVASHPGGGLFTEVDVTDVPEIWHNAGLP
jgi:(2Fe-2S) ferredoxin